MPAASIERRTLLAGLATSLLFGGKALARDEAAGASPGIWRDLELLDADDRSFRVDDLAKPFTLIKLWAHWCPNCLWDLQSFPKAAQALQRHDVDIILVSHPSDWARNQAIAQARNLPFRTARPSTGNTQHSVRSALLAPDGMFYVPRNLLFSRARQSVVWSHLGGLDWTAPDSLAGLQPWIGGA